METLGALEQGSLRQDTKFELMIFRESTAPFRYRFTHDQERSNDCCSRVAVMDAVGRYSRGTPDKEDI